MDNVAQVPDWITEPAHPQWAKLEDLKAGDTVELHGFDCAEGTVTLQQHWYTGELFFPCAEGNHYVDGCLDDNGHLIGITIRPADRPWLDDLLGRAEDHSPATQIIPITQTERTPMSDFNPDDANSVSRFFQGLADKVVLASTLPKEVEDLRKAVDALKADVESYREHMARADEEISNLRRERQALQDENSLLHDSLSKMTNEHAVAEQRWGQACSERDNWHSQANDLLQSLETTKRERDDAQMKVMEMEDTVRRMSDDHERVLRERDTYFQRLNAIRDAANA